MMQRATQIAATILWFFLFGLAVSSLPTASSDRSDLICHTSNPAECYPRVFEPTSDFQTVHDDQDLPPGLHVRLNIATGKKEAKIYDPTEDINEALEGLPVDQSVVVVEPEGSVEVQDIPAMRDQVPQQPPAYDAAGKIQPPRDQDESGGEMGTFLSAVKVLNDWATQNDESALLFALEDLSDLSHDIYYGSELMKRPNALNTLVSLASSSGDSSSSSRHRAASILGHSVQNNPTALKEAKKSWSASADTRCKAKDTDCQTRGIISALHSGLRPESDPGAMKAKMYALSGLVKDHPLRDEFLALDGTNALEAIFLREGREWNPVRVRIAQLLMDHFLDEAMGAELGLWPQQDTAGKETCNKINNSGDGCWEHHLHNKALLGADYDDEWRSTFIKLLGEAREAIAKSEKEHKEL